TMTMNRIAIVTLILGGLAGTGCKSHLLFVEEDHLGLKATFEANNPSPVQVSVGYRRGIVAVIPQKSNGDADTAQPVKPGDQPAASADSGVTVTSTNAPGADDTKSKTMIIQSNPNEL